MCTNLMIGVVGDGFVGKSCLLTSYVTNTFRCGYVCTVVDNCSANVMVDGKPVEIDFWDFIETKEYDGLRLVLYRQIDAFVLCFSVKDPVSFEMIERKWIPEIRRYRPDVPIILAGCKIDLREGIAATSGGRRLVTYDEGSALAKKLKLKYCETSALTQQGLKTCFDEAIRSCLSVSKSAKQKGGFRFGKKQKEVPPPPVMPPASLAPELKVEASTFGEDLYKMLVNPKHTDVTFILEGCQKLEAHKLVLSSASKVFERIVRMSSTTQNNQLLSIDHEYTTEKLKSGAVPGVERVYESGGNENLKTTVEISEDISAETFVHVLEFLYSGVPKLPELDEKGQAAIKDLDRVAGIFKLSQLQTICSYKLKEQEFLNPSIGTYLNTLTGASMKKMFLNQPEIADVKFIVEGETVYAHKSVLCTRCEVMAAMFEGHFMEGSRGISEIKLPDTSCECFLAFLEYLYTDNAPIEETDAVGLLVLADKYGLKRLQNLCELSITKNVDKQATKNSEKSVIRCVIGLLLMSQSHNAVQLSDWCLHFISSYCLAFQKRKEFSLLTGDNKRYVDEHMWPPVSYLEEIAEYEQKYCEKKSNSCRLM